MDAPTTQIDVASVSAMRTLVTPRELGSFSPTVRSLSRVRRFHPHMLRHTFACEWVHRSMSPKEIGFPETLFAP